MTFSIILGLAMFLTTLLATRLHILAARKRAQPLDIAVLKGKQPLPPVAGGGLVLVFALIIGLLASDISLVVVLALLLLASLGLVKRLLSVPGFVTVLVELLCILLVLENLHHGLFAGLPETPDKLLTTLFWWWLMRCSRQLEAVEGLPSLIAIAIAGSMVLLLSLMGAFPGQLSHFALVLACAGAGFFWWNKPPARIRLDAVGSLPLGFLLGLFLILLSQAGYGISALILPAYLLGDVTLTLLRRLYRWRFPLLGHAHFYVQRFIGAGRSARTALRYIAGLHMLLAFLACFAAIEPAIGIFALAMAYFSLCMMLGFFAYSAHDSGHKI
jgi:Fuc2NAc and GlcNAc transferase